MQNQSETRFTFIFMIIFHENEYENMFSSTKAHTVLANGLLATPSTKQTWEASRANCPQISPPISMILRFYRRTTRKENEYGDAFQFLGEFEFLLYRDNEIVETGSISSYFRAVERWLVSWCSTGKPLFIFDQSKFETINNSVRR